MTFLIKGLVHVYYFMSLQIQIDITLNSYKDTLFFHRKTSSVVHLMRSQVAAWDSIGNKREVVDGVFNWCPFTCDAVMLPTGPPRLLRVESVFLTGFPRTSRAAFSEVSFL